MEKFAEFYDEIALLRRLIGFKSITPCDDGALDFIAEFMGAAGWSAEWFNGGAGAAATKNLLLRRDFLAGTNSNLAGAGGANSNLTAKPRVKLCFAGHIDVVPTDEFWTREPFLPSIEPRENSAENGANSNLTGADGADDVSGANGTKDAWLYGRGAQDMKGGVAAILTACRRLRHFNGEVMILLTSDEEGDGVFGTRFALAQLARRGDLPHFALVAEPTCAARFGDIVKVGRRGSINGVLRVRGRSGHAAYPAKCANPAHFAAPALARLAGAQLAAGDEFFEPTMLVLTDVRAGVEVCNVTPSELRAMFNVRNAPGVSLADVERAVLAAFEGDLNSNLNNGKADGENLSNSNLAQNLAQNCQNAINLAQNLAQNLASNSNLNNGSADGENSVIASGFEKTARQSTNPAQNAAKSSVADGANWSNSNLAQNPAQISAQNPAQNGANSTLPSAAHPQPTPHKSTTQRTFGEFEVELTLTQPSLPFLTDPAAPALRALMRVIARRCGGEPEPNCAGGTSDARHFAALGVAVAEFGTCNDTIHACDERVSTREVRELAAIFTEFLAEF